MLETTETNYAIMRYTKSLTLSPTVAIRVLTSLEPFFLRFCTFFVFKRGDVMLVKYCLELFQRSVAGKYLMSLNS